MVAPPAHEEEIDLEADIAAMMTSESEGELAEFFESADIECQRRIVLEGAGAEVLDVPSLVQVDPAVAEVVAGEVSAQAGGAGLASEPLEASTGASSSSGDAMPAPAFTGVEVPSPIAPWDQLSPVTSSGYVYLEGRSVMRIQRGKPARSVTVNCYRHPRCTMLLQESMCPSDDELKRWLFMVEPPPLGCTTAESREFAARHMAIGKAKWTKKGSQQS